MKRSVVHLSCVLLVFSLFGCGDPDAEADVQVAKPKTVPKADFYVSPKGSDENPGSEARPFATVQRAVDAAGPGKRIYLRGGTYHPKKLTLFKKSGQAHAYIELQGHPGETVVIDGGKLPGDDVTWSFQRTAYWKIGHVHLTNGRGAGLEIYKSQFIELDQVQSSYNGKAAARGGHGFTVHGDGTADILFKNCDANHNANHKTKPGEDVPENIYQHGDGWRVFAGKNVRLVGCRAWHNLDDAYDLTQANDPIELVNCWAAYSGVDDAKGSITGKPGLTMDAITRGDGFKLSYTGHPGQHRTIRCLSWNNFHAGWTFGGGPHKVINCGSYGNGMRGLHIWSNLPHVMYNNYEVANKSEWMRLPNPEHTSHNSWSKFAMGDTEQFKYRKEFSREHRAAAVKSVTFTVTKDDFLSVDDAGMLGPRGPDGSLPETNFMKLKPGSDLIDAGTDAKLPFKGKAPDIGPYESGTK